ncbi:MAG: hypothetical protein ACQEQB_01080 [Bacteroidota bacterium]
MKNIFLILLSLFLLGCEEKKNLEENSGKKMEDSIAFSQNLNITNQEVLLLPEARAVTSEWLAYLTAQIEIDNFDKYTVNEVVSNARPIAEIMRSLRETLPDTLKSNATEARLAVIYTKAMVLEQQSKKRNPDPREIANIATEIPTEFNNFKIQLNELFLKTLEQFEMELDDFDAEQERDTTETSITRAPEIEDRV